MGKFRCDDLDEMDTCPECDGEGITWCCDECRDAYEEEERQHYSGEGRYN